MTGSLICHLLQQPVKSQVEKTRSYDGKRLGR
jgi:hypothetical protein